jgi:hypothetical protein
VARTTQAKVAQLVEHSTENAGVAGSIPALGTLYAQIGVNSLEKRLYTFFFCSSCGVDSKTDSKSEP